MPVLFIVDDDADILYALEAWFTLKNYQVKTFESSCGLIDTMLESKPDIVLLDVYLKGEDGRNICRTIREQVHYPVKIILSSATPAVLLSYEYNYADSMLNKPFELKDLEDKCSRLLSVGYKWFN